MAGDRSSQNSPYFVLLFIEVLSPQIRIWGWLLGPIWLSELVSACRELLVSVDEEGHFQDHSTIICLGSHLSELLRCSGSSRTDWHLGSARDWLRPCKCKCDIPFLSRLQFPHFQQLRTPATPPGHSPEPMESRAQTLLEIC